MKEAWKFGMGQTKNQERKEMTRAAQAGLNEEYMRRQRWARMVEVETSRRRREPVDYGSGRVQFHWRVDDPEPWMRRPYLWRVPRTERSP